MKTHKRTHTAANTEIGNLRNSFENLQTSVDNIYKILDERLPKPEVRVVRDPEA